MGTSASSHAATTKEVGPNPSPNTYASPAFPADNEKVARDPEAGENSMDHLIARAGRTRLTVVELHNVCGHTTHGVPAYSNGTSNTWTNTKSFRDGVFMGYQWQCVEFARRWLWTTQRLLLPERNCAYCFANCKHVYRLKNDLADTRRGAGQAAYPGSSDAATATTVLSSTPTSAASITTSAEVVQTVPGPRKDPKSWEKVPVVFVKQGSTVPPVPNSLIIYPMSWGSPWGHIGVITAVDLNRGLVYVADQNRYFHHWGEQAYSAVFPLEVRNGHYYIRDHESECKGWMTFPTVVEGH